MNSQYVSPSIMASYSFYTDNDLVDLLKSGNKDAFNEIYKRYWPLLYRHARSMLRDDEDATDVVQEIFTVLWAKSAELNQMNSLKAYLYTSVRNKIIDSLNRDKVKSNYLLSLQHFAENGHCYTDEMVLEKELIRIIDEEIAQLPAKMRRVFEMSRKSHLSYKQIAEEAEISEETVKTQIHKALKILRGKFKHLFFLNLF